MNRHFHTRVIQAVYDPEEAKQAEVMGTDYHPVGNIRRHRVDLLLVDHYTEGYIVHNDVHYPAVNLELATGTNKAIICSYDDFTAVFDAYHGQSSAEDVSGKSVVYKLTPA